MVRAQIIIASIFHVSLSVSVPVGRKLNVSDLNAVDLNSNVVGLGLGRIVTVVHSDLLHLINKNMIYLHGNRSAIDGALSLYINVSCR